MKTETLRKDMFHGIDGLRQRRRGRSIVRVLVAAFALSVFAAVPSAADDVAAGIDTWATSGGTVAADFCDGCAA